MTEIVDIYIRWKTDNNNWSNIFDWSHRIRDISLNLVQPQIISQVFLAYINVKLLFLWIVLPCGGMKYSLAFYSPTIIFEIWDISFLQLRCVLNLLKADQWNITYNEKNYFNIHIWLQLLRLIFDLLWNVCPLTRFQLDDKFVFRVPNIINTYQYISY